MPLGVTGKKLASGWLYCQVASEESGRTFHCCSSAQLPFLCGSLLFKMNETEDCAYSSTVTDNAKCEVRGFI